jgi:dTDP-4-dehydrorhamnose 3,5-epimerase
MRTIETSIPGVYILETKLLKDHRGTFSRIFCADNLKHILQNKTIVQMNHSMTHAVGAIRGLHFQHPPYAEIKIVRCIKGRVFDVAVDLRQASPTFLSWTYCELDPLEGRALVIPEGCAHGFQTLEPDSQLLYLHTAFYTPNAEGTVRYNDPRINITWPLTPTDLSEKDKNQPTLTELFSGVML